MDTGEKINYLAKMEESFLCQKVLVPLLRKKDYAWVKYTHGSGEKGKDIVGYYCDKEGDKVYMAVVAKQGKITQQAGRSKNSREIVDQVNMCFENPYQEENVIQKCLIIVTSITENARADIRNGIKKYVNQVKFIDAAELVKDVDQYMPGYFQPEKCFLERYYGSIKSDYEKMQELQRLGLGKPLELKKVFVALKLEEKMSQKDRTLRIAGLLSDPIRKDFEPKLLSEALRARLDINEAMRIFKQMVIVGDPGAGKTTLLRFLVLTHIDELIKGDSKNLLPILITLQDYASNKTERLQEFMMASFVKYATSEFPEVKIQNYVNKKLESNQCLILLDGFDEVAEEQQNKITNGVIEFAKEFPENQIILTSRIAGYKDEFTPSPTSDTTTDTTKGIPIFAKLSIDKFDDIQIKEFVENWFEKSKDAHALLKILDKSGEKIKDFVRNPLHLTIIAIIFSKGKGTLPRRRCELYERCVNLLLGDWKPEVKYKFDKDNKEQILRKLALELHRKNKKKIEYKPLIKHITKEFLPDGCLEETAKEVLNEIWVKNGILREIERGKYEFLHLSFLEYLAAKELYELRNNPLTEKEILSHIIDPHWQEIILLFLGILRNATLIMPAIWRDIKKDKKLLPFAGRCLVDADYTPKNIKEDIMHGIFEAMLTESTFSDDLPVMKKSIAGIGMDIIPEMDKFLTNNDWRVVQHAADILGMMREEEAFESLKKLLSHHPNANVRYSALQGLMGLKDNLEAGELVKKTCIIDPAKLKGNKPFEIDVRGRKIIANHDGKHPGMVFIPTGGTSNQGFWMDIFPVTNVDFEKVFPKHKKERSEYSPYDDSPVIWVSWEEANKYARQVGKRLPTEAEWKSAARGTEGKEFPWGDESDVNKCRAELAWQDGASRVNTVYSENVGDFAVYEMAGNVWEWTSDWYDLKNKDYGHVSKGGSWWNVVALCRCGARDVVIYIDLNYIGFRCCQ